MKLYEWLKPGVGIKRWISLSISGLFLVILGLAPFLYHTRLLIENIIINIVILCIGLTIIVLSIRQGILSLLTIVTEHSNMPEITKDSFDEMLYRKRTLMKGPKVVVIGGGTGLSVFLKGLKQYTENITAIVTVADDGGGSGILREDLGMLPPGDIRSCIIALADTEPTMERLLQYRFIEGKLKGQSFGNLFIAAMNGIYGNFERAIKEMSNVLAVVGRVLPMTLEDVKLYAVLENGIEIEGESNIPEENKRLGSRIDYVYIKPEIIYPLEEALMAIEEADAIVFGPGSLYTSVIPNILVNGMVDSIMKSSGLKIYASNVMTQPGETDEYNVLNHVEAILKHSQEKIVDFCIVNTEEIPKETLEKYHMDGAQPVKITYEQEKSLRDKGIEVIKEPLIDVKHDYIRHDALKLSETIMELVNSKKSKGELTNLINQFINKKP